MVQRKLATIFLEPDTSRPVVYGTTCDVMLTKTGRIPPSSTSKTDEVTMYSWRRYGIWHIFDGAGSDGALDC